MSTNVLQEADGITSGARRQDYGHPYDDYSRTAALWSAILGREVRPDQAVMCMIAVKLSRLVNQPSHRDSMVDVAGYIRVYELVREAMSDGIPADLAQLVKDKRFIGPSDRTHFATVPSDVDPDKDYIVSCTKDGKLACTCPDHQYRNRTCKHIRRSIFA